MAGTNRTGRVSAIDYKAGTYEVTYFDRGKSVTRQINAISNGEYKMPSIGQVVSVSHNSNGAAAGTTTGTVWNKTTPRRRATRACSERSTPREGDWLMSATTRTPAFTPSM